MTKNKNKKSSEAAKQEAFKLSDGICYCKTPVILRISDFSHYKIGNIKVSRQIVRIPENT